MPSTSTAVAVKLFNQIAITAIHCIHDEAATILAGSGSDLLVLVDQRPLNRINNVVPAGVVVHLIRSSSGNLIVVGGHEHLSLLDKRNLSKLSELQTHSWIMDFELSRNELIVVEMDCRLNVYEIGSGLKLRSSAIVGNLSSDLYSAKLFIDNNHTVKLALGFPLAGLQIWSDENGLWESGGDCPIYDLDVFENGRFVATAGGDRSVRLWGRLDAGDYRLLSSKYGHSARVWRIAFSSEGVLASCGEDCVVCLWAGVDREHLVLARKLSVHGNSGRFEQNVWSLCWADCQRLLLGCSDGKIVDVEFNDDDETTELIRVESSQPRFCAIVDDSKLLVLLRNGCLLMGPLEKSERKLECIRSEDPDFADCAFHVRLSSCLFVSIVGKCLFLTADGSQVVKIDLPHENGLRNVRSFGNDRILIQTSDLRRATILRLTENQFHKLIEIDFDGIRRQITCFYYVSFAQTYLFGCYNGRVLYFSENREKIQTILHKFRHSQTVNGLCSSSATDKIVSFGDDGLLCEYLVDSAKVRLLRQFHIADRCRIERSLSKTHAFACFSSDTFQIVQKIDEDDSYAVVCSYKMGSSRRSWDSAIVDDESLLVFIRNGCVHFVRQRLVAIQAKSAGLHSATIREATLIDDQFSFVSVSDDHRIRLSFVQQKDRLRSQTLFESLSSCLGLTFVEFRDERRFVIGCGGRLQVVAIDFTDLARIALVDVFDFLDRLKSDLDAKLLDLERFGEQSLFLIGNDCFLRTIEFDGSSFSDPKISDRLEWTPVCLAKFDNRTAVIGFTSGTVAFATPENLQPGLFNPVHCPLGAVCSLATVSDFVLSGHDSGHLICRLVKNAAGTVDNFYCQILWTLQPHGSCLTGLIATETSILTVSTDQRIKQYEMDESFEKEPILKSSQITNVCDVQGVTMNAHRILIYGAGIELMDLV